MVVPTGHWASLHPSTLQPCRNNDWSILYTLMAFALSVNSSCFESQTDVQMRIKQCVMKVIASSGSFKSRKYFNKNHAFNAHAFLHSAGVRRKVVEYRKSQAVYHQGDPATRVMYIQQGGVKLSVVNKVGREAVVAILGAADFFGEGCLAGQRV